jgi:hypothetical protein
MRSSLRCALAVFLFLLVTPAFGQATRTWVSGVGDDANPCSRTAPCKTFAGAISKTAAGGEISVLDPGGFGGVTITKSITINGEGTLAGILVSSGSNGIIVNAGVNDKVVLRHLSIHGVGTGANGIRFIAGRELLIEDVTIDAFATRGIEVALSAAGSTVIGRRVTISRVPTGIRMTTTAGAVVGIFSDVSLNGLTTGFEAATNGVATIRNATVSRNSTGVLASGAASSITLEDSILSFNGIGASASVSGSTVNLIGNQISLNTTPYSVGGTGTVSSDGQNRAFGNGAGSPNGAIGVQ